MNHIKPSASMRPLGRSDRYTGDNLPARLRRWHAPRANRWEHLCVVAGRLEIQWLDAGGTVTQSLATGHKRWIAPGMRWRVLRMDAHACFRLDIHADDASPAGKPQPVRASVLDAVDSVWVENEAALAPLVTGLGPGDHRLVRAGFALDRPLLSAMADHAGTLSWHPLAAAPDSHAALIVRSRRHVDLFEYMGRDHAVIEAALAGALRGDAERKQWLCNSLMRHLAIEEEWLFPAYLDAGGRAGWVCGLRNEHQRLREHLDTMADPRTHRRFLLLLDGHDEKEEQTVYPDILAWLGDDAEALTRRVINLGLA